MSSATATEPKRRRKHRGPTPIEQTACGYDHAPRGDRDAPEFEPLRTEVADPVLAFRRDVLACHLTALVIESRLTRYFRGTPVPADDWVPAVELLWLFAEVSLLDRAHHPGEYIEADADEAEPEPEYAAVTEGHARYAGLTVFTPADRAKGRGEGADGYAHVGPHCTLPGCEGESLIPDWECPKGGMRPPRRRFCPACQAEYARRNRPGYDDSPALEAR